MSKEIIIPKLYSCKKCGHSMSTHRYFHDDKSMSCCADKCNCKKFVKYKLDEIINVAILIERERIMNVLKELKKEPIRYECDKSGMMGHIKKGDWIEYEEFKNRMDIVYSKLLDRMP